MTSHLQKSIINWTYVLILSNLISYPIDKHILLFHTKLYSLLISAGTILQEYSTGGSVQDCETPYNTLELPLSCAKPAICGYPDRNVYEQHHRGSTTYNYNLSSYNSNSDISL